MGMDKALKVTILILKTKCRMGVPFCHWLPCTCSTLLAIFSHTEQIYHNRAPLPGGFFGGSCLPHYFWCSEESNVELWSTH